MLYGLYLSAQGAEVQSFRQAVVANNIANAGTTSFKRDFAVVRSHEPYDAAHGSTNKVPDTLEQQTGGLSIEGTWTDFSQGALTSTGNNFDVALVGPGFLQVSDGANTYLTRNGRMALNSDNGLVLGDTGHAVLATDGTPLTVPPNLSQLSINPEGLVAAVDLAGNRVAVGQIGVVEPQQTTDLVKEGKSLYRSLGPVNPVTETQIRQNTIEESGIDPMDETVTLIETNRGFEMNMNMIRMQDEMLSRLLQSASPA